MRAAERGLPRFWLLGESLEEGHGKEWGGTSYCTNEHEKWASIPGLLGGGAQGPQEISTLLYSNLYCSKKRSTLSEANSLVWQNVTLPICRFNKTGFIAESWGTKKLASVEYNNKTVPLTRWRIRHFVSNLKSVYFWQIYLRGKVPYILLNWILGGQCAEWV